LEAHVWIILTAMVLSVLAAVAVFALKPTKYVASSSVMVKPEVINGVPTEAQMGTEAAIASSGSVLQRAADLLNKPEPVVRQGLSVANQVDTTVLRISFKAATPTAAFNGAGAVTRAYVDYRNSGGDARVAQVITPASLPGGPSAVNYTLIITVAAIAGFMIGIAASVVWDWTLGRAGIDVPPSGGQPSNGRPDGQPRPAMDPWPRPRRKNDATQHESPSPDHGIKD
jgi:uncharacterized protein involved in exopolysaccharide biosynthesis